jgi:hypothetical protein
MTRPDVIGRPDRRFVPTSGRDDVRLFVPQPSANSPIPLALSLDSIASSAVVRYGNNIQ